MQGHCFSKAGDAIGSDIQITGSKLRMRWGHPAFFQLDSMAIHWACRGGNLAVVAALKDHGVDLNVRDKVTVCEFCLCITCLAVSTPQ